MLTPWKFTTGLALQWMLLDVREDVAADDGPWTFHSSSFDIDAYQDILALLEAHGPMAMDLLSAVTSSEPDIELSAAVTTVTNLLAPGSSPAERR